MPGASDATKPITHAFFDEPTCTASDLATDPATGEAPVIDPVLDHDANAGEVDTRSVEAGLSQMSCELLRTA
jgi:hypothetical protein